MGMGAWLPGWQHCCCYFEEGHPRLKRAVRHSGACRSPPSGSPTPSEALPCFLKFRVFPNSSRGSTSTPSPPCPHFHFHFLPADHDNLVSCGNASQSAPKAVTTAVSGLVGPGPLDHPVAAPEVPPLLALQRTVSTAYTHPVPACRCTSTTLTPSPTTVVTWAHGRWAAGIGGHRYRRLAAGPQCVRPLGSAC